VAPAPTPRSSKGNHEANVLIESEKLAKPYVEQFWFDWRARSFPILEKKPDGSGGWQAVKPTELPAAPEPKKVLFA
jgi:phosphatidylserine/phosphatidylglycerophosphate/cardiolipin synthase-like enzyme